MGSSARVISIDALRDFRASVVKFQEDASAALVAAEMDIHRMIDWLQSEQPRYWSQQMDRCREEIARAKTELSRKRLGNVGDGHASLVVEKESLAKAQRRMRYAEEKLEVVRKWSRLVERGVYEYQGTARPLSTRLETELPKAMAALDGMLTALEEYAHLSPTIERPSVTTTSRTNEEVVPMDDAPTLGEEETP